MKVCFIVNPAAGGVGSTFQKQVVKAANQLAKQGCKVERVETKAKDDGIQVSRQAAAAGFEVAVAVGGDGTINEVCNGLAGTNTALAVVPAGTGNVYAADLGIPIWSPLHFDAVTEAVKLIMAGRRRRIDLGRLHLANGASRYFLMWCGIGLDAAITQAKSPSTPVRELNYASWVVAGLMVTFDFMGTQATITTDNGTEKQRVLMALASNGQLYGRLWRIAPEAKMDDGLLDVAVMSGHRWPSTIKHVLGLTFRQHVKDPDFHLYRTTRLRLSTKETLPVHVDADPIGATPIEIEVAPLALNVIVPHNAPERLFQAYANSTSG
ncbi:MAG: diacylglycerol kinase family lipid kinase [Anaerolineae bacterium]|nr:diacylglycerol kinase family lipid kinase [Anaerolineae bacterium]